MISAVLDHPVAMETVVDNPESIPDYGRALDYISASRLSCWQQCRRKHYFRYIADIPSKPSPAMHLGKVVHATLQQWNLWRWDQIQYTRSDLIRTFLGAWQKEKLDNPVKWKSDLEEVKLRNKAWSLVSTYLDEQVIDEDEDIAGVEVRLEAKLPDLPPVIGIVDLVREGGRIVDFKTAAKSPSEGSIAHVHGTQLAIYALLYRHCTGAREGGLELHHLVKTKEPKVCVSEIDPLGDREIVNVIELLHRYVNAVMAEDYTASPSFMCAGCEHLERCKQWPDSMVKGDTQ
ncbi:PD-(D/E)XK nuclease family protein [Verrucomicrobiaceae bacterium N1E253]|uniref:PD-(D/E)XK nuclease family protein n=1 Tax=Oceaniferula marina TaxID=2748318 RepID=A0A851GBJ6_9BACT|nr:PD-(D/E)XK nuclease family protein [Oceaniferula marina]NWK54983.1 PD-(D/E)XK nuclease family protein [Oceaniferula marina]